MTKKLLAWAIAAAALVAGGPAAGGGEVVLPLSGRLSLTVTDLSVDAGAIELPFSRALAQRNEAGLLGARWRSNWDSRVARTRTHAVVEELSGDVVFTPGRDGGYVSSSGEQLAFERDGRALRTRMDGSRELFDASGRLVERDLRNGNRIFVRHGADGRPTRIEGPHGSFVQFGADARGRVVEARGSTGAQVRYVYAGDDLVEVGADGAAPLRYGYAADGTLTRIADPRTGWVELAYDAKGRVLSRRWADGAEERYEYDDAARLQRRIDAAGGVTTLRWSGDARRVELTDPIGGKTTVDFDAAARPLAITGAGGQTARIAYDARGRVAAVQDASGGTTRYDYVGLTGLPTTIVRGDGRRQTVEYDAQHNLANIKVGAQDVMALGYNADGTLRAARSWGGGERTLDHDGRGRVRALANALGQRIQIDHDARGNPVRAVDPTGAAWSWQWDAQGRLVAQTDPAGAESRYEYDAAGRLARFVAPGGGARHYTYDARGRLVSESDPAGQAVHYAYDRGGRLAKVSAVDANVSVRHDAAGNPSEAVDAHGRRLYLERDAAGRPALLRGSTGFELRYSYDARGRLASIEERNGAQLHLQRDEHGRVHALRDALGATTQFEYDALGNVVARRDARGHLKRFVPGSNGLLARVIEPTGDAAEYRHDAADRLVEIVRPSSGTSRYAYDAMGRLVQETDPLGKVQRYEYDPAGRLTARTDARGSTTRHEYDRGGRISATSRSDGTRVAFRRDEHGRLLEADDGAFALRHHRDREGRLVQVEFAAISRSIRYEYDASGLRTKLIDTQGRATGYEYDTHKLPRAIVTPEGRRIELRHDAQLRLQSIGYPNGITGRWQYDAAGRIAGLAWTARDGKPVAAWSYRYDPAGNLVQEQDHTGRSTSYAYDPAGQLIEAATPQRVLRYRYGAGGRRVTMEDGTAVTSYRHDAGDRMVQAGAETLVYDDNGNLIRRAQAAGAATRYEYDAGDRLVKVVPANGTATSFGYAPNGARAWRRDGGGLTTFVHDGLDLIAELDDKGEPKASYTHGPGLDQPLAMQRDGRSYYYLADRLGSVRVLTDEQGQVVATYDYDPFGNLRASHDAVPNPFTFTGREWDAATGLYYLRARYYDPRLGRFMSTEPLPVPLAEPLDLDPYRYARNQPLRFVDRLGLAPNEPPPSIDELLARQRHLEELQWRNLRAQSGLQERTMLDPTTPRIDKLTGERDWSRDLYRSFEQIKAPLNRLEAVAAKHQAELQNIQAQLNASGYKPPPAPPPSHELTPSEVDWLKRHGYDDMPEQSPGPTKPAADSSQRGPLGRFWQGVKNFLGGGGAPPAAGAAGSRGKTIQVEVPGKAARPLTVQVPRPDGGAGVGPAGTNPYSGELKAAGVIGLILIGVTIADSDNPAETAAGIAIEALRTAGINTLFGPAGVLVDTGIHAGRGVVDMVDAIVRSDIPPPPPLLPVPDPVTGVIPPPPFPLPEFADGRRPSPQAPSDLLRPGLSGPSADQVATAQGLGDSGAGGILPPSGTGAAGASGVDQKDYLNPSSPSRPPLQPGQELQLPLCPAQDAQGRTIMVPCAPGQRPPQTWRPGQVPVDAQQPSPRTPPAPGDRAAPPVAAGGGAAAPKVAAPGPAPTPGAGQAGQPVRVNCFSACVQGCLANAGGSGYFAGMCAPHGPCDKSRVTLAACERHCAGYRQDRLVGPGDGLVRACGGAPAVAPAPAPAPAGATCGPATSCKCANGAQGHIPCDKSKGACHCGGG